MGSVIYDFLNASVLFDEGHLENAFSAISDADLRKELSRYCNHIESNLTQIREDATADQQQFSIVGSREFFNLERLAQTALYVDVVALPDPLLQYTKPSTQVREEIGKYLGFPQTWDLDRERIARAASFMRSLRGAVAANYVRFIPEEKDLHPPVDLPLTSSSDGYAHRVPEHLREFYLRNVIVRSIAHTGNIARLKPLVDGSSDIAIQFGSTGETEFYSYSYAHMDVADIDENTGCANFTMRRPDEPLDQATFDGWLKQSIYQSAGENLAAISRLLHQATSPFTQALLGSSARVQDIETFTGDCFLNLDLQFFRNISLEKVLQVRQSDGGAFALFRTSLQGKLRELRLEQDQTKVQAKAQEAMHELAEVQVQQISRKVEGLKKGAFADGLIAVAGLVGSMASPFSWAAVLAAGAHAYKKKNEYQSQIVENPSYFLWRAQK